MKFLVDKFNLYRKEIMRNNMWKIHLFSYSNLE